MIHDESCRRSTVTALIKEARKYGTGIILSWQETRDFHPSVFDNTGTLIGLALEEEDAGGMSKDMGLTDKTEKTQAKQMLLYQANGQALIHSQHFLPYAQIKIFFFEEMCSSSAKMRRISGRSVASVYANQYN